jgi:2-haloacid dehalogenase
MPIRAYAFDAYGTLFDVHSAIARHREAIGEDADAVSAMWRVKQLEYSWVRTLMGRYQDFWQLTQEALDFTLARFPSVDKKLKAALLDAYWRLGAYDDVLPTLTRLRLMGHETAIFTNGTYAMADAAANAAAVAPHIDMIVSVDEIGMFKTKAETYAHLCAKLGHDPREICLVSSNRWDIAGGSAFGLRTIWVNRAGMPDEYFDAQPDQDVRSLSEIG